jgi:tRNA-Thr(GGU) m(6)t(6)A37 methyltransferase TsaA
LKRDAKDTIHPIGFVRSSIKTRGEGPKQGHEGAPDAWIDVNPSLAAALEGTEVGDEIIVITWLHLADRTELRVRPRGNPANSMTGVFATRSPDRPNPVGLHRATVLEVDANRIKVGPMEAVDGTPVIDIKPVLTRSADS